MLQILPPDDTHPPRPDVPVLRHLTFTEAHAAELGGAFGLLLTWLIILDWHLVAAAFVFIVVRRIISHHHAKNPHRRCGHDIGFHDVIEEPVYFVVATCTVTLLGVVLLA